MDEKKCILRQNVKHMMGRTIDFWFEGWVWEHYCKRKEE